MLAESLILNKLVTKEPASFTACQALDWYLRHRGTMASGDKKISGPFARERAES